MTELQFLIHILLEHKLPKVTKELVAKRIGEVEQNMGRPMVRNTVIQEQPQKLINGAPQAASTIAAMERDGVPNQTPIVTAPLPALTPSAFAMNRIKGGEVNTGKGTRGPRKF